MLGRYISHLEESFREPVKTQQQNKSFYGWEHSFAKEVSFSGSVYRKKMASVFFLTLGCSTLLTVIKLLQSMHISPLLKMLKLVQSMHIV
jgi:hypothetical protein